MMHTSLDNRFVTPCSSFLRKSSTKIHVRTLSLNIFVSFLLAHCIILLQQDVIALEPWINPRNK